MVISGFVKDINNKVVKILKKEKEQVFPKNEAIFKLLERKIYVWSLWDKLYKQDLIKKKIYFNPELKMGEDLDFIWKVINISNKIGYISLNKYHYCYREDSAVTSKNPEKKFSSILVMKRILNELKDRNNIMYERMQELYIKELASCCKDIISSNKNEENVKYFQKEIRNNIKALIRNKDFILKVKLAIIFFLFPYNICKIFSKFLR